VHLTRSLPAQATLTSVPKTGWYCQHGSTPRGRADNPDRDAAGAVMLTVGCRPDWAGVCAFSPTSRITQRDGTTERDAPDNCTLLYPGDPGPRRPLHREVHGRPAAGRTPACSMIPGWRPPPGPGSPGVRSHAGGSPAIPEPGPRARRHPGVPAGLPFTRCAVTLDQLHRKGDGPRAAGTTDGGRQRTTAIQEDPVGGISADQAAGTAKPPATVSADSSSAPPAPPHSPARPVSAGYRQARHASPTAARSP
jgi:hypothetical protein